MSTRKSRKFLVFLSAVAIVMVSGCATGPVLNENASSGFRRLRSFLHKEVKAVDAPQNGFGLLLVIETDAAGKKLAIINREPGVTLSRAASSLAARQPQPCGTALDGSLAVFVSGRTSLAPPTYLPCQAVMDEVALEHSQNSSIALSVSATESNARKLIELSGLIDRMAADMRNNQRDLQSTLARINDEVRKIGASDQ
jgi:hypothetical protein